jgi:hypothetical protein
VSKSTALSVHRAWFDALKKDLDVPPVAMSVARVFSDYAARTNGKHVFVTYAALMDETHWKRDAIAGAIKYLVEYGWLAPVDHQPGKRAYYDLVVHNQSVMPTSSESDQSVTPTSTSRSDRPDQSVTPTANDITTGNVNPPAGVSPLVRGFLRNLGATDDEAHWIETKIKERGARNVVAVLRAEQQQGTLPALLSEARKATYARPVWCGKCNENSRLVELADGRAARCNDCHPGAQERPVRHLTAV